jgi:hypothetical protein
MIKNNFYISEEILKNCVDPVLLKETIDKARCEPYIVIVSEEERRTDEQTDNKDNNE